MHRKMENWLELKNDELQFQSCTTVRERKTAFSLSADDLLNYFLVRINFKDYFYISFSSSVVCRVDITSLTQQILCTLYGMRRTETKYLWPHTFPTVAIALFYTQFFAY